MLFSLYHRYDVAKDILDELISYKIELDNYVSQPYWRTQAILIIDLLMEHILTKNSKDMTYLPTIEEISSFHNINKIKELKGNKFSSKYLDNIKRKSLSEFEQASHEKIFVLIQINCLRPVAQKYFFQII